MNKTHRQLVFWPECHEASSPAQRTDSQPWRCVLTFEQIGLLLLAVMALTTVSFCWGVATGERKVLAALRAKQVSKTASRTKIEVGNKIPSTPPTILAAAVSDGDASTAEVLGADQPSSHRAVSEASKTSDGPGSSESKAVTAENPPREKTVDKIYTIQVASFKRLRSAKKEAEELRRRGFEVKVLPKGNYKIVCVGEFKEKNEAASFKKKLPSRYKDSLIRSL